VRAAKFLLSHCLPNVLAQQGAGSLSGGEDCKAMPIRRTFQIGFHIIIHILHF